MHAFGRVIALIILSAVVASFAACGVPMGGSGEYYSFTDSEGRNVSLDSAPVRVAVLFSSYAEIWQIAGGEIAVTVGDTVERGFADADCVLVDSGAGHTTLDTELLIASAPDLVIGTADYPVQVEACELLSEMGIPTALLRVETFEDYLTVLKIFTDILGTEDKYLEYGSAVAERIDGYLAAVSAHLESSPCEESMLFIRAGSSSRSTKAKRAEDHFACAMLEELGLYNIADSAPVLLDGLSVEEIVTADPERIFVSMMGENEKAVMANVEGILQKDGYSTLGAVVGGRVEFLPKSLFHYKPNHRWAEAYLYLIEIIYPELEL